MSDDTPLSEYYDHEQSNTDIILSFLSWTLLGSPP